MIAKFRRARHQAGLDGRAAARHRGGDPCVTTEGKDVTVIEEPMV